MLHFYFSYTVKKPYNYSQINFGPLMDTSTWIATLSFLVALLAAIYARWASFEAKRSNDLAFHTNKIEIYKEFLVLKYAILQREENISYEDTKKFYFSHLYSEFFFSEQTHNKIKQYFDTCFDIAGKPIDASRLDELKKKEKRKRTGCRS